MTRLIARLLLALAVLWMPSGMTAAYSAPHESPATEMPMGHCPDEQRGHDRKVGIADCTMACAAALPAAERTGSTAVIRPVTLIVTAQPQRLHGLHPETPTPPPR